MKILVVDDIEVNRHLLTWILEDEGHTTIEAENGMIAVDLCVSNLPDLVLMDLMMPIMNGIEATKTIREMEGGDQVPIIAITASPVDKLLQEWVEVAGNEVLCKPVNEEELLAIINKYSRKY